MPIDGIHTYTVHYKRRRNFATTTTTTAVTQRWPVTRSRARRAAIDATWIAIARRPPTYDWVRVAPTVPLP